MGTGIPMFGAGWFGVRARHGQRRRRVRAVHADDHRAGDGRRPRDLRRAEEDRRASTIDVDGDHVHAPLRPHGLPARRVSTARSATPIDIAPKDKVDFYFKCSPSPDGKGFDTEPALVHVRRHEEARDGRAIDGTLTLHDSPLDPIADIPVGRIVSMQFARGRDHAGRRGRRARPGRLAAPVRAPALRRPVGARARRTDVTT